MGRTAEERREGEEHDRAGEVALSAEKSRQPTRHWDDDDVSDDVRGRDPRDLVERRAEVSHHVRDGDVDDRSIDQLEHRRHRDGGGNDVFVRVAVLGGCRYPRRTQYGRAHRFEVSTWTFAES